MTRLHIVSLGSSFAAGPSIEPTENAAAGRSSRNYAHQLAKKLDADLTDLSVSGATLPNVLNEKQITELETFDPQLKHLPPDADIITLTGGGNDLQYIGNLCNDAVMNLIAPDDPWSSKYAQSPALTLQRLVGRFIEVLDGIQKIAPKAQVYLVEYLAILGPKTTPESSGISVEQIRHSEGVANLLSQANHEAAKARPGVHVVPIAEMSKEHALGSNEPWIEGFSMEMLRRGPTPYHPNLAGHTAIAEILHQRITADRGSA